MPESVYVQALQQAVAGAAIASPVLSRLGEVSDPSEMQQLAKRHYAEVRTFIDVKLPSRLRICTRDASVAKRFFSHVYEEEQGNFEPGRDHASIFAKFCVAIGLTQEELDAEFENYWPNYQYLLSEPPGRAAMLRELATSFAWESMAPHLASSLSQLLARVQSAFGMDDATLKDAAEYFPGHVELDSKHSQEALDALLAYVDTEEDLKFACEAILETIVASNPWSLSLHLPPGTV